ncbi:MAG: MBL fold metallo-hydrolase [Betaproteobacteria bacterium RIFCSPLOWO2_12_FULL_62_58]|nr:MAG: MBL fold metallo-hydrolase [Betaproteobacteria bacterium RIFCSPLOWO2_12_FULL_62_58]
MSAIVAGKLKPVDSLEVSVLVDNVVDPLSTLPQGVTSESAVLKAKGLMVTSGHARCCANHGLSLVITARVGNDIQILLFDAGPEAYTFARNGDRLRTPFSEVGAIFLSHGHWDHGGGIPEALRLVTSANGGKPVPCHVNEGMFATRGLRRPDGMVIPAENVMKPLDLARRGAAVVNSPDARVIMEQMFYVSGEIPRVTPYERGLPPHVTLAQDGVNWKPDPLILDERYVAAHVKGKGVVVFTACSHAGVINVLKDARNIFGDVPLYAVMGGFHLSGAEVEAIIPNTIRNFGEFALKRIVPCHCTGWRAVHALAQVYNDDVLVPAAVGRQFAF